MVDNEENDDLNDKVNKLGTKLTNLAGSVQDKTKDTFSDVKNKTTQAVDLIKDKYSEASEQIAAKASVAIDFAKNKYEDSKEATKGLLAQGLQAIGVFSSRKILTLLTDSPIKSLHTLKSLEFLSIALLIPH